MIVEIRPFGFECLVASTIDEAVKTMRDEYGIEFEAPPNCECCVVTDVNEGGRWFVMVLPDDIGVHKIAHECIHAADFAMQFAMVPTGVKNTEIRAYIVDDLMRQILGDNKATTLKAIRKASRKQEARDNG